MPGNYGANQYKQMSIKTSNRGNLLLMFYEAAIKNTKQAIDCIEKKDLPGKGTFIGKTHDIINELMNTLNFEIGGEIARDLERLYAFIIEQLIKSNLENTTEPLISTQKILENLLSGWKEAVQKSNKELLKT